MVQQLKLIGHHQATVTALSCVEQPDSGTAHHCSSTSLLDYSAAHRLQQADRAIATVAAGSCLNISQATARRPGPQGATLLTFQLDVRCKWRVQTHRPSRRRRRRWLPEGTGRGLFASVGLFSWLARACKKRTSEAPFRPTNAGCHAPLEVLPVASVKGGRVKPYVWDGSAIRAVEPAVLHEGETHHGRLVDHVKQLHAAVLGSFLPQNEDVTPDYWDYARWRAAHRLFSSVLSIFATQSLLQAVGVGARKTLPAAAAINWVLKDGLGRLGRLTVAARFGQSFDADLKRFRWATSLLFAGCISLEYLTPLFPHHFLLLASVANVGKSIGLTTYISTQPAIQKSFARHENLADIMAKAQAQQMVFDNIGLAVAVTLTYLVRNSPQARMRMPLIALPLLLGGDLFAIYHELKSIHLRTLNKERAELIAEHWLQTGAIPSTKQVSKAEPLLTAPRVGRGQLRLQITSLEESLRDPDTLGLLLERHRKDRYMLACNACKALPMSNAAQAHGIGRVASWLGRVVPHGRPQLALLLHEHVQTRDVLTGVLQAAYLRSLSAGAAGQPATSAVSEASYADLQSSEPRTESAAGAGTSAPAHQAGHMQSNPPSKSGATHSGNDEWAGQPVPGLRNSTGASIGAAWPCSQAALDASHAWAVANAPRFLEQLQKSQWQINPFLLSSLERAAYTELA